MVVLLESLLPASGYRTVLEYSIAENISAIASVALDIITLYGVIIGYDEYKKHIEEQKNKLFSHLNEEYLSSNEIQDVVKYLQIKNPVKYRPSQYKVDLFLRFFEELGLYLEKKEIDAKKAKHFFGFYLERIITHNSEYKLLQDMIETDREAQKSKFIADDSWKYLRICLIAMDIIDEQNLIKIQNNDE